jgi:tight adherence protein C
MDAGRFVTTGSLLWSPMTFSALIALGALLVWMALAPARPRHDVKDRLDGYLDRVDIIQADELSKPFFSRTISPLFRRVLRLIGGLWPSRSAERTRQSLEQAGNPGRLTVLDFFGLRVLAMLLMGVGYFLLAYEKQGFSIALRNGAVIGIVGYFIPTFWLRSRVRRRKNEITRALPDALDMLTIGVEAGLAFESAMLRVGEKWDNALTQEFRRTVGEMQVGMSREAALERMADRCGVQDLSTFVAVLVQSGQLGVSIAQVLHAQAAGMRLKRRLRAEELARQAGIKMVFPLVFLLFPALFVVIFGPIVPTLMSTVQNLSGGP